MHQLSRRHRGWVDTVAGRSVTATVVRQRNAVESSGAGRAALTDVLPHVVALVPFALAIGAAGVANGLTGFDGLTGALALLAGSSQLAATELIGDGGGFILVVGAVLVINLRFMLYGAGVNRWFGELSRRQRFILSLPIVDQTFLICEDRFAGQTAVEWRRRYYLTATAMLIVAFVGCQLVGHQVGASLPNGLGLHMAAPLVFAGMLGKTLVGRPQIAAGLAATVGMSVAVGLPGGLGLPVAAGCGLLAGSAVARRSS